ncbi:MAG: glucose 1-dehydrogenase [Candidatus Eremiobacteraeota bacterium]|nr:glucose 1-dehydrogenase [Candidatus Eremiobacteraeota bacterium]
MKRLQGKVCIITGSSGGIGKGIAELLAGEGAKVIIADILEEKGHEAVKEITAQGGTASFRKLDVSDGESWQGAVDHAIAAYGRLDILVNNAGIAFSKPIIDMSLQEWRRVMAVNLDGVFLGIKHSVPAMKRNGAQGGAIVNISSNYVFVPGKGQAAYCASKSGVNAVTKVAAIEYAHDHIRVNTIYPGFVDTPMFDQVCSQFGKSKEEMLSIMARTVLLNRVGKPIDIARAVLFLASEDSDFVTGAELTVDGGEVIKRTFYDDMEKLAKEAAGAH